MNVWQPTCRPGPDVQAGWSEMQRVWCLEGHGQELPMLLMQEWRSAPQRIPAAVYLVASTQGWDGRDGCAFQAPRCAL